MESLLKILQQYWGYDSFRPMQEEAVMAVHTGRDSLIVLPTGGGKSLCFQAPAVEMPGMALVISPLISLMKDQVDGLKACGIEAACIHSGMTQAERLDTHEALQQARLDLLYISPERAVQERFIAYLQRMTLSFVAIDEAHCISQWGHDFRPEYRQIHTLREAFPQLPMHAYTATATPKVRDDIVQKLALRSPEMLVGSFDRPNLIYRVERREDQLGLRQICDVIDKHPQESGVIYCITRKNVEALCQALREKGVTALPYHAGLSDGARNANQDDFVKGEVDVIVATVAFGMGIDKSNVRYVVHAGMPKSIEHYQQESGRAGRDGLPADCVLLYNFGDYKTWEFLQKDLEGEPGVVARFKLDQMKQYCESIQCRRQKLLGYFGEVYPKDNCQGCDFCLTEMDLMDGEESARMTRSILQAVLAIGDIAGPSYTTKVLQGKFEAKMRARRHDEVAGAGALASHSQKSIRSWITQLSDQGFLDMVGEYYILHLTQKAYDYLEGAGTAAHLALPVVQTKKAKANLASWEGVDRDLFETLRNLRKDLAAESALPPYQVFSDATLRDLGRKKPASMMQLLEVHGVGQKKCRQYGETVLTCIADFLGEAYDPEEMPEAAPEAAAPSPVRLSYYAFFEQGYGIEEIAEQMERKPSTVIKYLSEYIQERAIEDISPWVSAHTIEQVRGAYETHGSYPLRPLYEALDEAVSYEDIRLCVASFLVAARS